MTDDPVADMIRESDKRLKALHAPADPVTGEGMEGPRRPLVIPDFPIPTQYVPEEMLAFPLVRRILEAGSIKDFARSFAPDYPAAKVEQYIKEAVVRERLRCDFPFWAATLVYIKNKGGGDDVLFRLTPPQRTIIDRFERARRAGRPIRLVLLKARQLGGSTLIQMYMAWLQLIHRRGLSSLIISLQTKASDEILDMYDRMIQAYPARYLHPQGEAFQQTELKWVGVGASGAIHRVPQRGCKVKLGSAEKPDSCRGGDYALVHLSEVGLWRKTDGKEPEDIVQAACSGVLYRPLTMIVYESTARGTGNFFHREYLAAKEGRSQFEPLFIRWFDIPQYELPFSSPADKRAFAAKLYAERDSDHIPSDREEPGKYLWQVWRDGATLEALHWYVTERAARSGHAKMSSEYPSDDIEAFTDLDSAVFDRYQVKRFEPACRTPKWTGELSACAAEGEDALRELAFHAEAAGNLAVWAKPEIDPEEEVADRYLVTVDIGGRSDGADFSVIVVFDRMMMAEGGKPAVVAQWYGHTDMDLLAWHAAQIAAWYDNALLVIESNTLETHDRERAVDGDQSLYILSQIAGVYPNLYARPQTPDEIRQGAPRRYGFHTNVSTKPMIISALQRVVREQLYVERDIRCLHELTVYERKPNGAFGAVAGDHDDLLMTRAIGLYICYHEMDLPRVIPRTAAVRPQAAVSAATL